MYDLKGELTVILITTW